MTAVDGLVAPGFDGVADAFRAAFDGAPDMGAAVAVRHEGRLVVDLRGGLADPAAGRPWEPDTPSVIFSCTKGLMSILAARLVQEGRLGYEDPVAHYWPEFATAGKQDARVVDLLAHRAGLPALREPLTVDELVDFEGVASRLAAQEPFWRPGEAYAYHPITHGWLAGEIIRRVTGMTPGAYFRELVSEPLDAEAWIGLPPDVQDRVARMSVGPTLARLTAEQEAAAPVDAPDWLGLAMTQGGALPRELVGDGTGWNDPRIRAAEIPGAGGIATAAALATIWSAVVVETDGVRLLDDAVLEAATTPRSEGAPFFAVPGPWPRWGAGFQLDSEARRYLSDRSLGHDGAGGQVAFGDRDARIGFAFLTNRMEAIDDHRGTRLVDAVRAAIG